MIVPQPKDAKHKIIMLRLLTEILENNYLANNLVFKGGTCAALRNVLDRFSVDLDFDLPAKSQSQAIREELYRIFAKLDLEIKDESPNYLQFFLKYDAPKYERNTLKLEINDQPSPNNVYEKVFLDEVNHMCNCHSLDTMFANKLFAAKERFLKNGKIAGRDFYDLHLFFYQGLKVNVDVIEERSKMSYGEYLISLIRFINEEVTEVLLEEDLNPLMKKDRLTTALKRIRPELLVFLNDELERSGGNQV